MSRESWFAERRLDYIDFRMMTCGWVRRSDIMRTFGVSMPQASVDLRRFLALHPGAIVYDKTRKRYARRKGYKTLRGFSRSVLVAVATLSMAKHPLGWI